MKNLLKNLWEGPSTTIAGGIKIGLAAFIGTEGLDLPPWVVAVILAVSGLLSVLEGPNKIK